MVPEPQPLLHADESQEEDKDLTPKYLRPLERDLKQVHQLLQRAAVQLRKSQLRQPDALFLTSGCFLTDGNIKLITHNFHLVVSQDVLTAPLKNWCYWETSGSALGCGEDHWKEIAYRAGRMP